MRCNDTLDCAATSGTYTVDFGCYCGYNANGYSYCQTLLGSSYMDDYVAFYKNWASSDTAKKSHIAENIEQNLLDYGSVSDLEEYTYYILYNGHAEFYYGADDCVTEILLGMFKDFYDSQDESDSVLILEIPIGVFFLFYS